MDDALRKLVEEEELRRYNMDLAEEWAEREARREKAFEAVVADMGPEYYRKYMMGRMEYRQGDRHWRWGYLEAVEHTMKLLGAFFGIHPERKNQETQEKIGAQGEGFLW